MARIALITIIGSFLLLNSCQKCAECARVSIENTTIDSTFREYCGGDLKEIQKIPSYKLNGVTYKWVCTDN